MKKIELALLFLLITTISRGQSNDFDLKNIEFKGVAFSTTREVIVKSFGPGKRVETNYECGFFTNDQEGAPYYQLAYTNYNYIGSDKEKSFYLQNVDFDAKGFTKLSYGEFILTGKTTEEDFVKIFGEKARDNFVRHDGFDTFMLYSKDRDDAALFWFRNGRLAKFEYWTPC